MYQIFLLQHNYLKRNKEAKSEIQKVRKRRRETHKQRVCEKTPSRIADNEKIDKRERTKQMHEIDINKEKILKKRGKNLDIVTDNPIFCSI